MKSFRIALFLICIASGLILCNKPNVHNQKDLDQNMLDMLMYHDNLGLFLRLKDADYASWLLDGMDSGLKVIARQFPEHRKLVDPFEKSYERELGPPIKAMRSALKKEDFTLAVDQYRLLTKRCNNCHKDLEVDKTVVDRSRDQLY